MKIFSTAEGTQKLCLVTNQNTQFVTNYTEQIYLRNSESPLSWSRNFPHFQCSSCSRTSEEHLTVLTMSVCPFDGCVFVRTTQTTRIDVSVGAPCYIMASVTLSRHVITEKGGHLRLITMTSDYIIATITLDITVNFFAYLT